MQRTLGVCYYPEHWPESMWAEDARRMAEAGLTWVRIAEFAWSRMEPKPGQYEWDWLDRAIETLSQAGLKVVLGTPTSTPPRWLLDKWPDMLPVAQDGHTRKYGSRRHYCYSHRGFRDDCALITLKMAERYGKDPRVHGWQLDNEYGNHNTTLSYSKAAREGFLQWLADKYKTIDALNEAWGNVFWSMEYDNFDQIDLPNQTVADANPSHWLDFRRYSSDQVADFNRVQSDILRAHTSTPLIHNFMSKSTDFDHFKVAADLDIASWDSYPLGYLEKHSALGEEWIARYAQQGDPDFQAFHHDLYRAVGRGRWWIMEQQPGPVNWAVYNPAPLPGMPRLWAWEAFAHGAEAVCFFRWRQAPFAQEQMHAGLLRPDSADAPAIHEVKQVAQELKQLSKAGTVQAKVALVFDYQSVWAWQIQPQGKGFEYFNLIFDFYRAMRRLGLSIDIVAPDCADLSQYKLVAMPGIMHIGKHLEKALEDFKGTVIAGPRTGSKTEDFQIPANLPPVMPDRNCTVTYVESLRPGVKRPLASGGFVHHWAEAIETDQDVLEGYTDGTPAFISKDKTVYLTGWPDDTALQNLLRSMCQRETIETMDLSGGLRVRDTDTHRFILNYGPDAEEFEGQSVAVADVIWKTLSPAKA
ncbi:beta-galactosidase [Pseudochrobactrum sp. MP213Fo]|uniref:beta-galactosidase n=1 Tax=Pseudochrobactrum sp. MP213Fo TaxID=3022250 RepID=UPI003B9E799F